MKFTVKDFSHKVCTIKHVLQINELYSIVHNLQC